MDTSETLGNDLDKVDIDPQFQVSSLRVDFEWAKTGDLRAEYMDTTSETLGNDLDKVDIDPQFQV